MTMIVTGAIVISVTYYINKRESKVDVEYPNSFGINMALFLSFSSLFQQGIEYEPKRFSTRIATVTFFFTSLVVFVAYSASLTSFLAIFKVTLPFTDLETMYHGTNYKIGSIRNTAFDNIFKHGNDLDKKIFKDRQEYVGSVTEGLDKSNVEEFAFLWDSGAMDFQIGQKCSHIAIPKTVLTSVLAYAIKKNSSYTNMFNYYLAKLQERGQLSRMWSLWSTEVRKDCFDNGPTGLGINNVLASFLVLGGAILISASAIVCERLLKINVKESKPVEKIDNTRKENGNGSEQELNLDRFKGQLILPEQNL